jgi:hypothetical protein
MQILRNIAQYQLLASTTGMLPAVYATSPGRAFFETWTNSPSALCRHGSLKSRRQTSQL